MAVLTLMASEKAEVQQLRLSQTKENAAGQQQDQQDFDEDEAVNHFLRIYAAFWYSCAIGVYALFGAIGLSGFLRSFLLGIFTCLVAAVTFFALIQLEQSFVALVADIL